MAHATSPDRLQHSNYREEIDDHMQEHAVVDRDLQRSEFGGFHFGAAFFGWLVTTGLATIVIALLSAAGSAVAVAAVDSVNAVSGQTASTVGLVSGILLVIALAISYYAGGYVAGRMSRFDGARQGVGVWLIGVLLTLILGGLGAALGAKYNVLQGLNLPHLPINQGSFTTGGLITSVAALLVTLAAAVLGGRAGERYHKKVDASGEIGTVEA